MTYNDFLTVLNIKIRSIQGVVAACSVFVTKEFVENELGELQAMIDGERRQPRETLAEQVETLRKQVLRLSRLVDPEFQYGGKSEGETLE